MRTCRGGLLFVGVLLLVFNQSHGQGILLGPPGYGGGGINYSRWGPRGGVGFSFGISGPLGYPGGFNPYWGPGFGRRTTIAILTPPPPPQVVFIAQPVLIEVPRPPLDDVPPVPDLDRVLPPPPKRAAPPPPPPAMKKEEPKPEKKDEADRELPRPPRVRENPWEEHNRLVEWAKEAFKQQEYGRAAQRIRQAIVLRPAEAMPYFLLSQALVAQGKYHEAQDAILAGLERRPTWPTTEYQPLNLYGDNGGDYTEHLQRLEAIVERHGRDPVALFVCGYALWFDGRRDEASQLFRRALERGEDWKAIGLFLDTLPPKTL